MQPTFAPIASLADIRRIEEMPLSSQYSSRSTLDIFRQAAVEYGERPALHFLLQGTGELLDKFTVKTELIDHD